MSKKNNRGGRKTWGWAWTKIWPHRNHPAHYRKIGDGRGKKRDEIEYMTYTHSPQVDLPDGKRVVTVCMHENVSKEERKKKQQGLLAPEKQRSYAYPKVYHGLRSALSADTDELSFADERDKKRADKLYKLLPRDEVPVTGGKGKYRKKNKPCK